MDPLVVAVVVTGWLAVSSVVLACAAAAGRSDRSLELARAPASAPRPGGLGEQGRARERVARLERRSGIADRRRAEVRDRRRAGARST